MYTAKTDRYETMAYRRCGCSGIKLSEISLGLGSNFDRRASEQNAREMMCTAFDSGITNFDIANCYGTPAGSAEETFGRILSTDFAPYRNEIMVSTKAGYGMWPGPYGQGGSRKYLVSSCDGSLKRTGLDYFDIFYHHCPDPDTPLEETMMALDYIVRSGRALYIGISSYLPETAEKVFEILRSLGTPCLVHQPSYSMLGRWIENGLIDLCEKNGVGIIGFSPLAGGRLSGKFLQDIPAEITQVSPEAEARGITPKLLTAMRGLQEIAANRGQTLEQMAISWVLRQKGVASALTSASRPQQIIESCKAVNGAGFADEELAAIDDVLIGV